ncbi:MAG: hypothetical protein AN484_15445 [Aphanizomenon flos-aquae WA102]|uniref:Uncharacterized protein n=1 Tax=Aphanizomenon flos-aquae WA102 TaxID=1710896 RepID=A0A1B7X0Q3_APHFL|nr:MAG: hypothetical protein AN484_15445 [Aphanizomenon flos-aquae WA102]
MRKQTARVGVHRALDLLRPGTHPEVGAAIHLADEARGQTAGQTQRPAYQLDVSTEGEVIRAGQRIHEALEHHAHMIARYERVDLLASPDVSRVERPVRMIGVDVEDVPRLRHLSVRQHAVLAHLLLDLLGLCEEPSVKRLGLLSRSREVVEPSACHAGNVSKDIA